MLAVGHPIRDSHPPGSRHAPAAPTSKMRYGYRLSYGAPLGSASPAIPMAMHGVGVRVVDYDFVAVTAATRLTSSHTCARVGVFVRISDFGVVR